MLQLFVVVALVHVKFCHPLKNIFACWFLLLYMSHDFGKLFNWNHRYGWTMNGFDLESLSVRWNSLFVQSLVFVDIAIGLFRISVCLAAVQILGNARLTISWE